MGNEQLDFRTRTERTVLVRARWTRAVRESAERYGVAWGYWELAAGFGLYDPSADAWRQALLDALVH